MSDPHVVDYEKHVQSLLRAIRQGDRPAFDSLVEAVGHEMRKLSAYHLRQQPPAHTLQTTALVNEAVVKLIHMLTTRQEKFPETREHLMALISQMMRFSLIDYARKQRMSLVPLDADDGRDEGHGTADLISIRTWSRGDLDTLLAIDEAITAIEKSDPTYGKRRSSAVELHLFGGMTYREIADELGVTDDTARRDCQLALSRLRAHLGPQGSQSDAHA